MKIKINWTWPSPCCWSIKRRDIVEAIMAKIIFNHCINPFLALTYSQENGGIKSNKTNTTPTKFSPPINMTITKLFNTLLIEVLKCTPII